MIFCELAKSSPKGTKNPWRTTHSTQTIFIRARTDFVLDGSDHPFVIPCSKSHGYAIFKEPAQFP